MIRYEGDNKSMLFLVKPIDSDVLLVCKRLPIGFMSDDAVIAAKNEYSIVMGMSHPGIVKYLDCFLNDSGEAMFIIMEHCKCGDLSDLIKLLMEQNVHLSEDLIILWFSQIVLALNYLHSSNIMHRDVKPNNIYMSSLFSVKIGDFGVSRLVDDTDHLATTQVGTPYFISPEICQSHTYSFESDIWSLGIILFMLTSLTQPFKGNSILEVVWNIVTKHVPRIDNLYSEDLNDLVVALLQKKPSDRPSLDSILKRSFIKNTMRKFCTHSSPSLFLSQIELSFLEKFENLFPESNKRVFCLDSGWIPFFCRSELTINVDYPDSDCFVDSPNVHGISKDALKNYRDIFQKDDKYIIVPIENDLILCIDRHSADERVRFEHAMANFKCKSKKLTSCAFNNACSGALLNTSQINLISKYAHVLNEWGWYFHFIHDSLVLDKCPLVGEKQCLDGNIMLDFLKELSGGTIEDAFPNTIKRAVADACCRESAQPGEVMEMEVVRDLYDNLLLCKDPFICAHNRCGILVFNPNFMEKVLSPKSVDKIIEKIK